MEPCCFSIQEVVASDHQVVLHKEMTQLLCLTAFKLLFLKLLCLCRCQYAETRDNKKKKPHPRECCFHDGRFLLSISRIYVVLGVTQTCTSTWKGHKKKNVRILQLFWSTFNHPGSDLLIRFCEFWSMFRVSGFSRNRWWNYYNKKDTLQFQLRLSPWRWPALIQGRSIAGLSP